MDYYLKLYMILKNIAQIYKLKDDYDNTLKYTQLLLKIT